VQQPATTAAAAQHRPPARPSRSRAAADGRRLGLAGRCNGSALIESRRGMYEVYAGDPIPGLGRVDAIRRQDALGGRDHKGLIVAR